MRAADRRIGPVIWKISEKSTMPGYLPSAVGRKIWVLIGPVGVVNSTTMSSFIVMLGAYDNGQVEGGRYDFAMVMDPSPVFTMRLAPPPFMRPRRSCSFFLSESVMGRSTEMWP